MKCPNCGTENHDDARFCKSCAAPQTPQTQAIPPPTAPASAVAAPPPPPWPPVPRHRRLPHEELLGLLGFAFFLVGLAVAFSRDPNLIPNFGRWFDLMSANRTVFVRPPDALIAAAAWFFGAVGVLEFVLAFLRLSFRWPPHRVAGRILTGLGDLAFGLLLLQYADRAITGAFLITVLIAVFAALLMVYVTLGVYWSGGRSAYWPFTVQPPMRE